MLKETKVDKAFIKLTDKFRKPNKDLGLIGASSESVIVFAEKMLGITLYAWQVDFLHKLELMIDGKLDKRYALAITSRQIGKSTWSGD